MRIIYFDIDCLRPDHLGCYGYDRPTSPTIDRIAREAACFDRYYCASSPCMPSRTALVSGRFGIRNGVVSNHSAGGRFRIDLQAYQGPKPENQMLMRQLRAHGYDTFSFSNFADRHYALWFMHGWTEYHTPNLKGGKETAAEVNAPLLAWLKHNARRENYFLHVNYWDAHRAYRMDASWAERFKDSPVRQPWPDEPAIAQHQQIKGWFTAQGQFSDGKSPFPLMPDSISNRRDFEKLVTGYDAAIAYVDAHLGQVLDELARQDVLDDAVIIISGDHGDAFGEHGIYSDHVNADECIHRVPLIVRWPGVAKAGHHSSALLYNVDLGPTLCDLLGMPVPAQWDGASFAPRLRGEERPGREFLVWDCALYAVQRAVRSDTHLYIHTYDDYGYGYAPVELYDLQRDPYQTRNLAVEQSEVATWCEQRMAAWVEEQLRKSPGASDPLVDVLRERGRA